MFAGFNLVHSAVSQNATFKKLTPNLKLFRVNALDGSVIRWLTLWEKVLKEVKGTSPRITDFRSGLIAYRLNRVPAILPLRILREFSDTSLVAAKLRDVFQTLPGVAPVQFPDA